MNSYRPEVKTISDEVWSNNAVRCPTREEAEDYVADLAARWMLVVETRVVECDDPPTYNWDETSCRIVPIKPGDVQ